MHERRDRESYDDSNRVVFGAPFPRKVKILIYFYKNSTNNHTNLVYVFVSTCSNISGRNAIQLIVSSPENVIELNLIAKDTHILFRRVENGKFQSN